jgi:hypothetical protein
VRKIEKYLNPKPGTVMAIIFPMSDDMRGTTMWKHLSLERADENATAMEPINATA